MVVIEYLKNTRFFRRQKRRHFQIKDNINRFCGWSKKLIQVLFFISSSNEYSDFAFFHSLILMYHEKAYKACCKKMFPKILNKNVDHVISTFVCLWVGNNIASFQCFYCNLFIQKSENSRLLWSLLSIWRHVEILHDLHLFHASLSLNRHLSELQVNLNWKYCGSVIFFIYGLWDFAFFYFSVPCQHPTGLPRSLTQIWSNLHFCRLSLLKVTHWCCGRHCCRGGCEFHPLPFCMGVAEKLFHMHMWVSNAQGLNSFTKFIFFTKLEVNQTNKKIAIVKRKIPFIRHVISTFQTVLVRIWPGISRTECTKWWKVSQKAQPGKFCGAARQMLFYWKSKVLL